MPSGFDCTSPDDAPKLSRSDIALLRQAANGRWGVPDVLKTEAIYQTYKILISSDATERDKNAASKAVVAFDKTDQDDERLALMREKLELERQKLARDQDAAPIDVDGHTRNQAAIELEAWRKEMRSRLNVAVAISVTTNSPGGTAQPPPTIEATATVTGSSTPNAPPIAPTSSTIS